MRDAAGLAKRSRDPGEVQLEPEATLRMGSGALQGQVTADTEVGSILTDLMERLEAGAFGFTQNPDGEYQGIRGSMGSGTPGRRSVSNRN